MTETQTPKLKTYRADFFGCIVNSAVAGSYPCVREVTAENEEAARLELYKTHEHISHLVLTEIGRGYPLAPVPEWDRLYSFRVACRHEGCTEAATYGEAQYTGWVLDTRPKDGNAYYCPAHSH